MSDNLKEREAFEAKFPPPSGVTWGVDGYEVEDSRMDSYRCDRFVGQWAAWQARAAIEANTPAVPDLNRLAPFLNGLGKAILSEMLEDLAAAPQPQPVAQPVRASEAEKLMDAAGLCRRCAAPKE